jgi:hydroxyacylglutathione hydrolase
MKVEQIYTGCIAHAAYYLESNGEAAIFDPLREVQPYITKATTDNAKIKYVFETHFHADFVSGHLDLAQKTGAQIVYGPTAKPQFEAIVATDNQEFKVGSYTVRAIHTPGHTMESTCYLLIDESGKEHGLISGDTLFIGDVGRPDLAQHVISELTPELLASHLYDSIHTKILPLNDAIIVYPNHGAGSACGKHMSKETTDTLGNQKRTNYALDPNLNREQFIAKLLEGQRTPPAYFPENVLLNIKGYTSFDTVLKQGLRPLDPETFETIANLEEALLLDTRDPEVFAKGFIPNSVNIGIDGNFAMWVGALVPGVKHPILLITDEGREEESITRLARIGYDHVLGYLKGGFDTWVKAGKETDIANRISAVAFEQQYSDKLLIFDVRNESEFAAEHVEGATNVPLDYLNYNLSRFPKDKPFVIHCAGGYRSMIASSILKSRGWEQFVDVQGGFSAIAETSVPKTAFVCQSKTA